MWNKIAYSVQRTAYKRDVKGFFISVLLYAVIVTAPVWGQDELILTEVITSPQIINYVRSAPTQDPILNVTTLAKSQQNSAYVSPGVGWNTYPPSGSLNGITANTHAVFLSVWAVCEDVSGDPEEPEAIYGFVSIRQPEQTDWYWRRDVEEPYHYGNIYMDGANPPFFLICPVNESGQIEYQYYFNATASGGTSFRYQFYITILGYLEGTYED